MLNDPNGQDWDDWKKDWPMPNPPPYPADDEDETEPDENGYTKADHDYLTELLSND